MPTLTYRHPSEPLRLTVDFAGTYDSDRPRYLDRVEFGYPTAYNTQHNGPAARIEPAGEPGSLDDLYRALHALADFLSADAETYDSVTSGRTAGAEYCTRADVAEHAYRHAEELSELALFLAERERFATLLHNAPDTEAATYLSQDLQGYVEDLSEEDRAVWQLFTAPSTAADYMWQRFTYQR